MIELYTHNQSAYEAVTAQLDEAGKAAVIHPTGTGKSFIAFKLAEENPGARFVWVSPSEYIFRTQLENVRRIAGFEPENIAFLTYARLMLLGGDELAELSPDYIVLDEFHRCGAAEWSKGVTALLEAYPDAKLVGLTATNIRYLDNQRDMADELFDGCVASRMSLSEAVVRGILPAPKYVVTMYSCREELERYERRAKKAGGAARQAAEEYLQRLRRMLEQAEGLDAVFARHMEDKNGKYLCFCANREHMKQMRAKAGEWFGRIDPGMHTYEVYSESGESRTEYEKFRADDSAHLKLLYCIDMLNEGIHVDDLSGVILFRPTVSPIIYKQQIGRALSAVKGRGRAPVIFDVVNNFENLYSISGMQAEMEELVRYYRNERREELIVRESFEVIDEVRECRALFNEIERALDASWELMYTEAKAYRQKYGDLNAPKNYRTEGNLSLGMWLMTQRKVRKGTCPGRLTEEQIAKLDALGMRWESWQEQSWEAGYRHAKEYREAHGDLDVPARYMSDDGYPLGRWIANMRVREKGMSGFKALTEEQEARLNGLGMIWDRNDYAFEQGCLAAMRYRIAHGDLQVPAGYVDGEGFKLGQWMRYERANREALTEAQARRLESLGMRWEGANESAWTAAYAEAKRYRDTYGNLNPPLNYERNGIRLRKWLNNQRASEARGKLGAERKRLLDGLGMAWEKRDSWEENYGRARSYYMEHGDLEIPDNYVTGDGAWLGSWLRAQRIAWNEDRLSKEQAHRLEEIGMRWETKRERQWNRMYDEARRCLERNGGRIPKDYRIATGEQLYEWLRRQRSRARQGKTEAWQTEKLSALSRIC